MRNLKKLVFVGYASACIAATALTGCKMLGDHSSSSSDRTAGRELDDKNITENVQKKLESEPIYKFTDVDVKTFAGVVQLSGFVSTEDQKRRAAEVAQTVDGVTQVVNNLTLKPGTSLSPTSRTNEVNQPSQSP
jgi:hyperosmotically inducible protein